MWCTFYHGQELKVICLKHSCLVQNTFTLLNYTGSQEKGLWAFDGPPTSIPCPYAPQSSERTAMEHQAREPSLSSAWVCNKNWHFKLHCRQPEVETPLKTGNIVSMATWAVSLRKPPPDFQFLSPCAMNSSTLSHQELKPQCPSSFLSPSTLKCSWWAGLG